MPQTRSTDGLARGVTGVDPRALKKRTKPDV